MFEELNNKTEVKRLLKSLSVHFNTKIVYLVYTSADSPVRSKELGVYQILISVLQELNNKTEVKRLLNPLSVHLNKKIVNLVFTSADIPFRSK